jgi:hypothetical protein
MDRPSTVSVANARDRSTLGVLGPTVKLGFMAGQSMASMENHQIWARNLRISGQKLNSAAPSQKMQLRTNPRMTPLMTDQITRFTIITRFTTLALLSTCWTVPLPLCFHRTAEWHKPCFQEVSRRLAGLGVTNWNVGGHYVGAMLCRM